MTEFIVKALKEQTTKDRREKLKLVSKLFLTHRQMGLCETYYRALSHLNLVGSNIGDEFIQTGTDKSKFLKKLEEDDVPRAKQRKLVQISDREGLYVETLTLNDKYKMRPPNLQNMCLIQFV